VSGLQYAAYWNREDRVARQQGQLLPGTFDMLILKALSLGPMHGWGVADRIERLSDGVCTVPQGAVYPALQRVLRQGWATAQWRTTDNQRRARYYALTASGRAQLKREAAWWQRMTAGIEAVLRASAREV